MSETTLVVQLPKELEKQLRAHYDEMISNAVARVFEDKELYKPCLLYTSSGWIFAFQNDNSGSKMDN